MKRTVEEIKAEITLLEEEITETTEDCGDLEYVNGVRHYNRAKIKKLNNEIAGIITAGIPLDRLAEICAAEKGGAE